MRWAVGPFAVDVHVVYWDREGVADAEVAGAGQKSLFLALLFLPDVFL